MKLSSSNTSLKFFFKTPFFFHFFTLTPGAFFRPPDVVLSAVHGDLLSAVHGDLLSVVHGDLLSAIHGDLLFSDFPIEDPELNWRWR